MMNKMQYNEFVIIDNFDVSDCLYNDSEEFVCQCILSSVCASAIEVYIDHVP